MLTFSVSVGRGISPTFSGIDKVCQNQKAAQLDEWLKVVEAKINNSDYLQDIKCTQRFLREANCMLDAIRDVGWRYPTRSLLELAKDCYKEVSLRGELFKSVFEIFGRELDFNMCKDDPCRLNELPPKVESLLHVLGSIRSHRNARVIILVKTIFVSSVLLKILQRPGHLDSWSFVEYVGRKHQANPVVGSYAMAITEFASVKGCKALITTLSTPLQDVAEGISAVIYFSPLSPPGREVDSFATSRVIHITDM